MRATRKVKLFGGPLDGRTVEVPQSAESYAVGSFWTYTFAGKDGGATMFAKRSASRVARRFEFWYAGQYGRDPRVERALGRRSPHRGRTDRRGQGARRRAERRAAQVA